ncbi:TPA: ubiquinol-cytochrome C reductase [Klebsiella aerogenes]|nr:ubiquinol-cytochrome C reductase [Klebsiella aerogenes]HBW0985619.1 ubiquinol-cytochrome C reductase [Klebsiella aerogenes]
MSIYNDFVRVSFPDTEKDELMKLSARAECAADSILNGVAAVGKLMFYAGDIDNSVYEPTASDFRDIGGMLMELMPLAQALTDTAANAECHCRLLGKTK